MIIHIYIQCDEFIIILAYRATKPAECDLHDTSELAECELHDTSESAECELHDTSVDVDELAKAPSLGER